MNYKTDTKIWPIVIFAVGENGCNVIIDIVNRDNVEKNLIDLANEEVEFIYRQKRGIHKWTFKWDFSFDYEGIPDCEFVPFDKEILFDYEEYKGIKL